MRIYWHSPSPWSYGSYSVLTRRLLPYLVQDHEVEIGAFAAIAGFPIPWGVTDEHTVVVRPMGMSQRRGAADLMKPLYDVLKPDVCISASDSFIYEAGDTKDFYWVPWCPVDYEPIPKLIADSLVSADHILVYSNWGVDRLRESGFKAHYVPGAADADFWHPSLNSPKEERQHSAALKDLDFLVTMVSANVDRMDDRKGFREALLGFKLFNEQHPNSALYLHCGWTGPVHLIELVRRLGLEGKVIQPDQYSFALNLLDDNYLRRMYWCSDVLLNTSKSEGFGLPVIEAQMCGVPVAMTDFANVDEVVKTGWKIAGDRCWSDGPDAFRLRVRPDEVAESLEKAYCQNGAIGSDKIRERVLEFDQPAVYENHWIPALEVIKNGRPC